MHVVIAMVFTVVLLVQPFRGEGLHCYQGRRARSRQLGKYDLFDDANSFFDHKRLLHGLPHLSEHFGRNFQGYVHGLALCESFVPLTERPRGWATQHHMLQSYEHIRPDKKDSLLWTKVIDVGVLHTPISLGRFHTMLQRLPMVIVLE